MTTPQNPVALAANTIRQLGETANQTVMTLGNQFAQTNSQILRAVATGAPPGPLALPLLNGLAPGANANPGHNGNPNGAGPFGLPVPTEALRALGQLENSILPQGLPRPSAILLAAANGRPPAEAVEEATRPPTEPARFGAQVGVEGLNGLDRRGSRTGIQLV
jgi:hypothetical protein